jgi:hypothetical protein
MLPYSLDNRLIDGDEIISLSRRPRFTLRKSPGTHFCQTPCQPQGTVLLQGKVNLKITNDLIWNRTRDFPPLYSTSTNYATTFSNI